MLLPDIMGPFEPVTESEIDWFNSVLADEIDSAFSSSIRCCDGCFEGFNANWPGTTYRNMEFQRGAMAVDLLVTQSRLPSLYTPAEIATFRHFIRCPRCDNFVRDWIWIHEHAAADRLEPEIKRLAALAKRTPFLLLEDRFARQVLANIKRLGEEATAQPLARPLYRARVKDQIKSDQVGQVLAKEFGAPPGEFVVEGRFNHAGLPVLYLADSIATTVAEIGAPGHEFYVAALDLSGNFKILDLVVEEPDEPDWELLGVIATSALIAAPRTGKGWVKDEYIFTRFVADCAIAAGFDGIRYGSTKLHTGCNYVLLGPPKDITTVAAVTKIELIVA